MALNIYSATAGFPVGQGFENLGLSEKHAITVRLYERLLEQLAAQKRDADAYERSLLFQGIFWLGAGQCLQAIQYATLASLAEADRSPLAGGIEEVLPVDDGRPLPDLLWYAKRRERFDWKYASNEATFGILVRETTERGAIKVQIDALMKASPDRVILVSVAPHDVRQRVDWEDIKIYADVFPQDLEVRLLREEDLPVARRGITILTPPQGFGVI